MYSNLLLYTVKILYMNEVFGTINASHNVDIAIILLQVLSCTATFVTSVFAHSYQCHTILSIQLFFISTQCLNGSFIHPTNHFHSSLSTLPHFKVTNINLSACVIARSIHGLLSLFDNKFQSQTKLKTTHNILG